jgi:hypothetical protein
MSHNGPILRKLPAASHRTGGHPVHWFNVSPSASAQGDTVLQSSDTSIAAGIAATARELVQGSDAACFWPGTIELEVWELTNSNTHTHTLSLSVSERQSGLA